MQRRQIIKGSFSAPLVMTVITAPAVAASSSMRCVSNQASNPVIPAPINGTDSYVRVYLYVDDAGNHWIYGNDFAILPVAPGANVAKVGQWQRFDLASNRAGEITTTPPSGPTRSGKAVAIMFNSSGQVVGTGIVEGGTALTGSCWTSFIGTM